MAVSKASRLTRPFGHFRDLFTRGSTLSFRHNLSLETVTDATATVHCLEGIARRCEQNTGWKPILLYAVASSPWVRGDTVKIPVSTSLDTLQLNVG